MALDDRGNDRVDFVWGNMPLQRNFSNEDETDFRIWWELYPGDGEAEFYLDGHATAEDFNNQFGAGRMTADYQKPSVQLSGRDSEDIALRKWNDFPYNDANAGFQQFLPNGWFWSDGTVPGLEFPNIINLTEEEAKQALANCGVDPELLVPLEFDAPEEFRYIGYNPEYGYYDPLNVPGKDSPGLLVYAYKEPNYVIGSHWDNSDWLAKESNRRVWYTAPYVSELVPVATNPEYSNYPWWLSFLILQTEDPRFDSVQWWD